MEDNKVFETLSKIDCTEHVEKKKSNNTELTYLSWAWAWAYVKKQYPDATYTIYKDEHNRPYMEDEDFGLMCYTTVTIQGQTHEMWLPVMNGANRAMRRKAYTYQVFNKYEKCNEEKTVEAATMFDINKTIMRCLVKNLAMFGLGLYIYAGEDLPEDMDEDKQAPAEQQQKPDVEDDLKSMTPELINEYIKACDEIKNAQNFKQLECVVSYAEKKPYYKHICDKANQVCKDKGWRKEK